MEATVFRKKNIGKLRALVIDDEPYFSAEDLSTILSAELEYDYIMYNDIDSEDRIEAEIDDESVTICIRTALS